jgi:hypothetical protein
MDVMVTFKQINSAMGNPLSRLIFVSHQPPHRFIFRLNVIRLFSLLSVAMETASRLRFPTLIMHTPLGAAYDTTAQHSVKTVDTKTRH